MNGIFPVLEDLALTVEYPVADEEPDCPRLPQSFQAPRLRNLELAQVGDVVVEGLHLLWEQG